MQTNQTPVNWVRDIALALQWPVIVIAAFWLGKQMARLEVRLLKAEKGVTDLIEKHMPHVHAAIARVEAVLQTVQALVSR